MLMEEQANHFPHTGIGVHLPHPNHDLPDGLRTMPLLAGTEQTEVFPDCHDFVSLRRQVSSNLLLRIVGRKLTLSHIH